MDVNDRLEHHEDILKHLVAIGTRLDGYMARVTVNLEVLTALLTRRKDDEEEGA